MASNKIFIAMSGGVDSSVAAAILVEQGLDCVGVTLKTFCYANQNSSEKSCCSLDSINDAKNICQKLKIPHYVIDVNSQFKEKVVDNFIREYLTGHTPNPCVECNRHIKFGYLLKNVGAAKEDMIATGHYAQIEKMNSRFALKRGTDISKDQSYFLWGLSQDELSQTLFPLGGLTKEQTREIARQMGLKIAEKIDSQEICFVPDNNYGDFVKAHAAEEIQPGPIFDLSGKHLGNHGGIVNYTLGQRKGLRIAMNRPVYVVKIDAKKNAVYIGNDQDLFKSNVIVDQVNWVSISPPNLNITAFAQIRYRHEAAPGKLIYLPDGKVQFCFQEPQRAITPGQSAVFYDTDNKSILAGGVIDSVF